MSKPRTGAPKRVAVGLLAGALTIFGVALAPNAGANASVSTSRLAGATRYGTAAAIAGDATFAAPTTVIVSTGENFPDALAASTLAGANAPAPIVLTQTATYTADAKSALAALKGKGVGTVNIVGGTTAVSQSVEDAIKADGFTIVRTAGTDRYLTAAAIATAANAKSPSAPIGGFKTALIATGTNFPDALAGGPAAYANKIPLLLVNDTVPQATKDAIASLGIKKAVILGGTAAVSDAVKVQIDALTGNPSDRLAGTNRFGTAAAVGDYEAGTLGFPVTSAVLATGNNFPDALAAGPLGGQNKAPIALTASLPAETKAWLDKWSTKLSKLFVSGGTAVISDADVAEAQAAAQTISNDTPTSGTSVSTRPELQSATISSTNVTDGTTVKYCFDEAVTKTTNAAFRVYTSTGTGTSAGTALNDITDGKCVNALFAGITTAAGASALSLATVDEVAVTDNSTPAQTNPIGDVPLGAGGTTAFVAGITAAPDLVTVGGFTPDPVLLGFTQATFTFDEAAFDAGTNGYRLLRTDGTTVISCTYVSGTGTASIVVRCPTGAPAPTTGTIARGFDLAGTVTDSATGAGPNLNPLQAADVAATSAGPDLTSVTLTLDATAGLTKVDRVIYTFDEAVTTTFTTASFQVYLADGTTVTCGCTGTVRNEANQTQVSTDFPDNSLTNAVGGNVLASAVTGFTSGLPNQPDEEGAANAGSAAVTPGATDGPDLSGVIVSATKDPFGNITGGSVIFLFDESLLVGSSPTAGKFKAYLASGTTDTFTCTFVLAVSNTAPQTDKMAICGAWVTAPTIAQFPNLVLGTVDNAAVTAADAGVSNPEGASTTTVLGFS